MIESRDGGEEGKCDQTFAIGGNPFRIIKGCVCLWFGQKEVHQNKGKADSVCDDGAALFAKTLIRLRLQS
jgi:hypothetical protein